MAYVFASDVREGNAGSYGGGLGPGEGLIIQIITPIFVIRIQYVTQIMPRKPTLYLFDPDENEATVDMTTGDGLHIPREGELVYASDHTGDTVEAYDHEEMWRVTEVQTEFRLVDNIGGGESRQQLVYIRTEKQSDE